MGALSNQPPTEHQSFFHVYRVPFVFLVACVVCIVVAILLYLQTIPHDDAIQFSGENIEFSASESSTITVDVRGAVLRPGVYQLPVGSRVADAITQAGGVSDAIDTDLADKMINYANTLVDGVKIYVPKKENISSERSQSLTSTDAIVSVNTSSSTQLESLPGVGEVTAKKIIDNRPYGSLDELVTKHVISASLLEKLREQLSL